MYIKGLVLGEMKILHELLSSVEDKIRYFEECFCPHN